VQVQAEYGGTARNQIAFVPARQIAAGIPLKQGVAVPKRGRDQKQRDDGCGDPEQPGAADARPKNLCGDDPASRFSSPMPKVEAA
jgi:hypothetical protein